MNEVTEQTQKNISILRSSQPELKIELLETLAYSEIMNL